jgi:rare lipoprotein A
LGEAVRLDICRCAPLALLGIIAASAAHSQSWTGKASYYGYKGRTASGQTFNPGAMTAAHRTAPFGTRLKVTNLKNSSTTVVTVVDRGPFIRGRVIDVSRQAADVLGFRHAGVATVRVETLSASTDQR